MSWVGDFSILFLLIDFKIAAKFAHDAYFFLVQSRDSLLPPCLNLKEYQGQSQNIHDSVARFLTVWKKTKDRGLIGIGLGMHAFGLEETGNYPAAEKAALEVPTILSLFGIESK